MKVKYICVCLLFIYKFLFVKSTCDLIPGEISFSFITKLKCSSQLEQLTLYYRVKTTVDLGSPSSDGFYYFDVQNYQNKNILCDLTRIKFTPEITSFPIMPTTGGIFSFTYNFPCTFSINDIKPIFLSDINQVNPEFDFDRKMFNISISEGCGTQPLYFKNAANVLNNIFNASYQTGSISNSPTLDGDGNFIIKGSNLYKTSIKINSNDTIENAYPSPNIDASHSTIKFSIPESKYQGSWTIEVTICNTFYRSYSYTFSALLVGMTGVLNDNGGNITFTGYHLRSKNNITGVFGTKKIPCYSTTFSNNVTCTLPNRHDSNSTGYDIPLTLTIDGKYTTNTIKISYDLPLIQDVKQRGNSQIFNVTGVYLSGVVSMTVITDNKTKTDITKKSTQALEEPGFFIESNNTIFIFLPNNTQPGFMELVIGDDSESFTSPRYNFKIIPTITDGQSFESSTSGSEIHIYGIFMRTVDSDGRDVPITVSGDSGIGCSKLQDISGLYFACLLKSGFGSNHKLNVYYNLLPIGSFNVSYKAPELISCQQEEDGTIILNGKNLGDSPKDSILTVIYTDGSRANGTVISSSHGFLKFKYPVVDQKTTGFNLLFQLGDQKSNEVGPFILKPVIENTDPAVPCGGGIVTINGHYFFNYTKETTTVTIGKVPCNISSIDETTIECVIAPNLKSLSPYYTSGSKSLVISSSNPGAATVYQKQGGYYEYKYAPPTITNTSAIDQTALITIYGTSFGDANLEILIDGKPCTQPEINIHTYSSLTCNVTNYDEMLKYNYSDTKFNISISVDGQYFIAEIFQFKYESTISYGENKATGFPNEMYIGIVAVVIFLALIYFTVKTQIENYIQERRARKAFRSIDNLRLQLREKHAAEIAKVYSFGNQKAPKPDKSFFYDFRKKLSRLPLIRRCCKEHTD
ncbi:hypothetical protein ACTFIU_001828 [Dictyostelium citrinum]